MARRFENKKVFVTGAGIGIGFEICRQFASEGAIVAVNSLRPESTARACDRIKTEFPDATVLPYPGNVSDVDLMQSSIANFADDHGGLDIMVANAGITVFARFLDVKSDAFDNLMSVNMRGTYFSVQEAARQMIKRQTPGRIILMSSVCGMVSHDHTSSYGMTKAGIRHLAISLSDELGPHGITVNCLSPGATLTERTTEDQQYAEGWGSVVATKKPGTVEDVAYATLFLADDRASQITGDNLVIDGGWTIASQLPPYLEKELKQGE